MLAPEHESEAVVLREDQNDINTFARLLNEKLELEQTINLRKELLQLHSDASDELVLLDDESSPDGVTYVPFVVGDVFFHTPKDKVETKIESAKKSLEDEVSELEHKLDAVKAEMQRLKSHLYAKFGKSINLEDD